ncbi:MAG: hypothetical protein LDLANPLL_02872 [Turneriella sp.]|nr:hypothetical protein [Turneriella sp.]
MVLCSFFFLSVWNLFGERAYDRQSLIELIDCKPFGDAIGNYRWLRYGTQSTRRKGFSRQEKEANDLHGDKRIVAHDTSCLVS